MESGVESETDYVVVTQVVGQLDYRTLSGMVLPAVRQVVAAVVAGLACAVVAGMM